MKKLSYSSRTKRQKMKEEFDFFSDSTNFGIGNNLELEQNIILDNNVKIIEKSISQEVRQCPQTVTSSSHVNVDHLDNECVDSINTNDNLPLQNESDSTTSGSDNNYMLSNCSFSSEISQWAVMHKIPHTSINDLLFILKKHKCFTMLPKDARTLLGTKPVPILNMYEVQPGKYYHFGLENGIIRHFLRNNFIPQEIKLVIGIDGLPISKSTSTQFWPILAYIRPNSNLVFLVGLYCGTDKPCDSNEYLKYFVNEAQHLITNGICIQSKLYSVIISVFCCDTPAKSFVLKIKGHSGFFSCSRCEIEGEYKENRMCFPYSEPDKRSKTRTHNNYINRTQIGHHIISSTNSCISEIPKLDIVNNFSLDYMHLICLGVTKKLILLWMKGPLRVRLPSSKINQLSKLLVNLRLHFCCEFSRKPRKLEEVCRWKATEFRSFLLYLGPIVLNGIVNDSCFKNFIALNIAMIILLSPHHSSFVDYAREMLNYFVKTFEQIYGQHLMSHNVHGLLHLTDDYNNYGPLDNCSAFPFENYMQTLKSMLRKPHKPLEQVIMRYNEGANLNSTSNSEKEPLSHGSLLGSHNKGPLLNGISTGPQYSSFILGNCKVKSNIDADSYFYTKNFEIVKLINITYSKLSGNVILIGRQFKEKEDFYLQPINSSLLKIYKVKNLSKNLKHWDISEAKTKIMIMPCNDELVAFPLLHSI